MLAGLAVVVAVDRRVARAAPVDLILRRFGVRPARLLGLRTLELALTALGALAVLAIPLALMVVLLPRLVEPDTALPPEMPVQVTAPPLLLSVAAALGVMIVAAMAAARRSASLNPGEVLRDDT
jgi:ABC-type lipoprotein release transport system permease subunit